MHEACGPKIRFTAYHVMMIRELVKTGDRVRAEVYKVQEENETVLYPTEVLYVTILEKYPHVALTDRGTVSWVNILLHNADLLRHIGGKENE